MTILNTILDYNQSFVKNKQYEPFQTSKYPDKKLVILTCMDTRLVELLHHSMNLKNGDAKIIRNAGAIISHPFGSIMRSILIALYELKAEEVMVIGHHECGMAGLESTQVLKKAKERGVDMSLIDTLEFSGVDVNNFLTGFSAVEENVLHSVDMIKQHPLLPQDTLVHGLVICPDTGKLELLSNGHLSPTIHKHS